MLNRRILQIALESCASSCHEAASDNDVSEAIHYADAVMVLGRELRDQDKSYAMTMAAFDDMPPSISKPIRIDGSAA